MIWSSERCEAGPGGLAETVLTWAGAVTAPRRYHAGIALLDVLVRDVDIRYVGIAVLGPLEVDGTPSSLGLRDRVVLQALATRPGLVISQDSLAEAIWGGSPPASWAKVVQGCVVRLRKELGSEAIETSPQGYRLRLHVDHIDHLRFEHLVDRGRELLVLGEPERAAYLLGEALDLWRGDPFTELSGWAPGRIELERLVELRRDAEDLHTEAQLRSGRFQEVLAPAVRLVQEAPFRERRWGLLALAQYQDGRQRDALETLQRARTVMVTELGLDPGPDLASLEQAILRQDPSLAVSTALPRLSPVCPYLGLVAYDIQDAATYFGREADVQACLTRLDAAGVLAIVGPSGSGKSSLARAGVAAALEHDGRRVRVMTPGPRPMDALASAPGGARSVLVVDQCEEALSLEETSPERAEFFAALADFAATGQLILTLRADRLGDIAIHPAFAHVVERGLYLLGPMQPADLRRAIEGPAGQAGLRLEPGLVDLLVREVEGQPGALPLLSHVLRQTWTRREGSTLTVAGYTATGGVREAVAQSAESLFRGLTTRQQAMLRDLMLRLVTPDDAGDPVRTRASRRSVAPDEEHAAVIERLVGARLLSSDGDTVEIAHESLAVAWPRLRSWLDDDVEGLRIMRHLAVAADSWEETGRPESELYRGVRQAKAEQWRAQRHPTLTPSEQDFLDASAALLAAEQRATEEQVRRERRTNRRLRAGLAAVAAFLVIAVVTGGYAVTAARRAEQQTTAADARRLGAEALRSTEIDRSLLLAVAGTQLDDSADTRSNLTSVLDRTPQLLDSYRGPLMYSISMRPDGRRIATAGFMTGLTLVDAATLKEVRRNDDIPIRWVEFNPDGSQLVGSVNPFTTFGLRRVDPIPLRIFDPDTGELAPIQPGGVPRGRVVHTSFAFSNNGRWLAAAFIHPREEDHSSSIRVWDTRNVTRPVAAFTRPYLVYRLDVNDDASRIYAAAGPDDRLRVIDVARHRDLQSMQIAPGEVSLAPDGKSLAVLTGDGVALLDPERLSVQQVLEEDGELEGELRISPSGERIAYSVDGALAMRDLRDPTRPGVRFRTGQEAGGSAVAFSRDERTVYSTRGDGLLLAWDAVGDRQFVRSSPLPSQPDDASNFGAIPSPDGRTVGYFVDGDNESWAIQFLDLRSGTWTSRSPFVHSPAYFVDHVWHPASELFATAWNDDSVWLWDRRTARLVARHRLPRAHGAVEGIVFSGDGSRLVVGTTKGWVHVIDPASGRPAGRPFVATTKGPARSFGVNHAGSRAVSSAGGEVQLLDLSVGMVLRTKDMGFEVGSLAWSPDLKTVAASGNTTTGDGSGRLALLEPQTLAVRTTPSGSQAPDGGAITYSADGSRFVTAASDRVSLWDAATVGFLGSLRVEDAYSVRFDPGTNHVLIASALPSLSVWNPQPEAAGKAACQLAGRDITEQEWASYLPDRPRESVCPQ